MKCMPTQARRGGAVGIVRDMAGSIGHDRDSMYC